MKILELIGIKDNTLSLSENSKNHIGTIHASALFLLAENASGKYLKSQFPELKNSVIPLLRQSNIKYKKTAIGTITAFASLAENEKERFINQFSKKSRGTIEVNITLKNENDEIVSISSFTWFIQKIE
jgi:hypothetical protein